MKTNDLTGAALDWAVAKCEGKDNDCEIHAGNVLYGRVTSGFIQYRPSTDWAQGGPIIERKKITVIAMPNGSWATSTPLHAFHNPTPLIAAMRCYVASKLGDNIDLPKELT